VASRPVVFRSLPRHLLWSMTGAIRAKLARGYRPAQILDVLQAPLPPGGADRPYRLAIWRLALNQPGAGPRLEPLQRAWDARQDARQRQHAASAATSGCTP
jgi:hypothetical protein